MGSDEEDSELNDSVINVSKKTIQEKETNHQDKKRKRQKKPKLPEGVMEHIIDFLSDEEKSNNKHKKKPRMTTNKGKAGIHFYEFANVKNRKRRESYLWRETFQTHCSQEEGSGGGS